MTLVIYLCIKTNAYPLAKKNQINLSIMVDNGFLQCLDWRASRCVITFTAPPPLGGSYDFCKSECLLHKLDICFPSRQVRAINNSVRLIFFIITNPTKFQLLIIEYELM
ncbi:MAG: hypothetical protein RLZ12_917 [Bacillota bacterium]